MPGTKRRSCDSCRRRKIRCNGNQPCQNCDQTSCVFSVQKAMGRPRKWPRLVGAVKRPSRATSPSGFSKPNTDEELQLGMSADRARHPSDVSEQHNDQLYFSQVSQHVTAVPAFTWTSSDHFTGMDDGSMTFQASLLPQTSLQAHKPSPTMTIPSTQPESLTGTDGSIGEAFMHQSSPQRTLPKTPACTCLSSMYLSLSDLEATAEAGFPVALTPIKAALTTAKSILSCQECPKRLMSSRQNVMHVFSLLTAIAAGFKTLLGDIDTETRRAKEASETIFLDSGDSSMTNRHLHTGSPDCPGHMPLELEPDEWNVIVKRAVKKFAFKQRMDSLTLESLVDAVEERQRAWHHGQLPSDEHDTLQVEAAAAPEEQWTCLRMSQSVRTIMESFR